MISTVSLNRASLRGYGWLALLMLATLLLPWFEGDAIGRSALAEGLSGAPWLLPIVAAALMLLGHALISTEWRSHSLTVPLSAAAIGFVALQALGIGLHGPSLPILLELFPQSEQGQRGLGIGGVVATFAMLGILAEGLVARGFCRGERFAGICVVLIIALLATFVFFPIAKLGMLAFTGEDGSFALRPLIDRITDDRLWQVVANTLTVGVLSASLATAVGLALAIVVNRTTFRHKKLLRAVSILPIITPPFVVGVAIIVLFGRSGVITQFGADLFGIQPGRWVYGLSGILIAQVLAFTPVTFLVLSSALEAINPSLEEASQTLGARSITTFRKVTWPLLRPGIATAFLLAFIESLSDFGNPLVLGGGFDVLSTRIFFAVVGAQQDLGNASTLAIVLLSLTLMAFWLQQRWIGKASYVTVTGRSDGGLTMPAPRAIRYLALAITFPFLLCTIAIYAIVLAGGFVEDIARTALSPTIEHLWTAFSFEFDASGVSLYGSAWDSLVTTLWVSALSAPLTVGIGILTAWIVSRQRFIGRQAFEFGTMLSFAIPGTVVGVSYIVAFNVPPVDITGTMAILVICFVFRNMPVGMRAGMASLAQIDSSMEEASTTLGAGGGKTLRKIVLPLIRPAIFTGLVYAFVTAMTAVSAVIFLVSARHNMATAYIMGRVENGEYALAVAYSALLMLVMIACVGIIRTLVGHRRLGRRTESTDTSAAVAASQ